MMNSNYLAESVSLQKNFLKVFVLAVLFLSMPTWTEAQEAIELGKFLEEKSSDDSDVVKRFAFENVPAILWNQGSLATGTSQNAQKLVTDVASLASVMGENGQNRSVKFLQINIEKAAEKGQVRLNPENMGSFLNLQYVLIHSQVDLTASEVSAMVSGYEDGDIVLLFQVVSNF